MNCLFSSVASATLLIALSAPSAARQGPLGANTIVKTTGVVQEMTTNANLISGGRNESLGPPMPGTFRAPGTVFSYTSAESDIPGYVSINSGAANVHTNAYAAGSVLPSIDNVGTLKVFTDVGGKIAGIRDTSANSTVVYTNEINPKRAVVGFYVLTVDAEAHLFDFGGGAPSIDAEASVDAPGLTWSGTTEPPVIGAPQNPPVHTVEVGSLVTHVGPMSGPFPGAVPGEFTLTHSLSAAANGNSRARGYIQLHVEFFVTEVHKWHPPIPPIPMLGFPGAPGRWEKIAPVPNGG